MVPSTKYKKPQKLTLENFLACVNGVTDEPDAQGDYWAFCPCHNDGAKRGRRSLSIKEIENGRVLIYCYAGCSYHEIINKLGFKDHNIEAAWVYTDEKGKSLYEVCRGDKKKFFQRMPDGTPGTGNTRKILYRLPKLIKGIHKGKIVFIPEGEKHVDRLKDLGLCATTNSGGAGKWRPEYSEFLKGARVVILPDNDEPGRNHANQIAASLRGVAKLVKVVDIPGLPEKGDVVDWLDTGGNKKKLLRLVKKTPVWKPTEDATRITLKAVRFMDYPKGSETQKWVIKDILPAGRLMVLGGRPKVGKSSLIVCLIACALKGETFAGHKCADNIKILAFLGEDNPHSINRTLGFYGVTDGELYYPDPETRYALDRREFDKPGAELVKLAHSLDCGLLIIDPLAKVLKFKKTKPQFEDAYELMDEIKAEGEKLGVAVIAVHHTRKGEKGSTAITDLTDPTEELMGSTAYTANPDVIAIFGRHQNNPELRRLKGVGRDFVEFDLAFGWEALSQSDKGSGLYRPVIGKELVGATLSRLANQIYAYLGQGQKVTTKDLQDEFGRNWNDITKALRELEDARLLGIERGEKRNSWRYYRPDIVGNRMVDAMKRGLEARDFLNQ